MSKEKRKYTLEYWIDDGWYVGLLKEIPDVFSQGRTLEELEENIKEAFNLMHGDVNDFRKDTKEKIIELEV